MGLMEENMERYEEDAKGCLATIAAVPVFGAALAVFTAIPASAVVVDEDVAYARHILDASRRSRRNEVSAEDLMLFGFHFLVPIVGFAIAYEASVTRPELIALAGWYAMNAVDLAIASSWKREAGLL